MAELRAHLRIAACKDVKLQEELLKLSQPDSTGEPAEPLTSDMIWHATINYEQCQKCLRSESEEVAISSVSAPAKQKKICRTCTKLCNFNYEHCLEHKDSSMDTSDMECKLQGCANPRSDHNTAAHKAHNPRNKNYKSNPPAPRSRAVEAYMSKARDH